MVGTAAVKAAVVAVKAHPVAATIGAVLLVSSAAYLLTRRPSGGPSRYAVSFGEPVILSRGGFPVSARPIPPPPHKDGAVMVGELLVPRDWT